MSEIKRFYVEKKQGFDVAAQHLLSNLKNYLGFEKINNVRILIRYDIEGLSEEALQQAKTTIISEPPVDFVYDEKIELKATERKFAVEYLPGQYDQRADSAVQCIRMMAHNANPIIKAARVIVMDGDLSDDEFNSIKDYLINTVDSREAALEIPEHLTEEAPVPEDVKSIEGFIEMSEEQVAGVLKELSLAMSMDDLLHVQNYFKNDENRNPTLTEIRVLDTYWSDHCRHTTFLTELKEIEIAEGIFCKPIQDTLNEYQATREKVYGDRDKRRCLMDIAVLGAKDLIKSGTVNDIEVSDEINACSILVEADIDGEKEEWLVMFKNETHNHPTEIEPFGGAATCIGGCIRDPLSGRSWVYQAMRVTGAGDPRKTLSETLAGKLPQRRITTEAAHGYSSYGNQIGLATGLVTELYHEGYLAKRMEIGAVVAAAPRENVKRLTSDPGNIIVLVGGRTGRDGCGGATGSSKEHTDESIKTAGAEVQKGNAPTERKIQRLFRNPKVAKLIRKCNDFGAGGVSVAIGELADGLEIDLDKVPKKYDGLDGTELAISESQERMAVVLDKDDVEAFIKYSEEENLEAVEVAVVTEEPRMKLFWRGKAIVDMSREFIDTNGVLQSIDAKITDPVKEENYFNQSAGTGEQSIKDQWLEIMGDLNVCSQKGLIEHFDSTIGAGSVMLPFGGQHQETPTQTMIAKLPVTKGDTTTGTIMTYGFDPALSSWSPYHGALYAVIESLAKTVSSGGDHKKVRLTLQEYFERLGKEKEKWGKPLAALLGAFKAQKEFEIPAIGGKDSMSGTFEDISVPPTLVSFAVCATNVNEVITPEFKQAGSQLVYIPLERDNQEMPDFDKTNKQYSKLSEVIRQGKVLSAYAIGIGGLAAAVTKMGLGNKIGAALSADISRDVLFGANYGSIVCELDAAANPAEILEGITFTAVGTTAAEAAFTVGADKVDLEEARTKWVEPLEDVFPTMTKESKDEAPVVACETRNTNKPAVKSATPRVLIPVFPGTNCEYDTAKQFEEAGAEADVFVINNLTTAKIDESISEMARRIDNSQMIMIPGGFSAGDEPEGSGKFIAAVFRNPVIKDAVHRLLQQRDGLMLGICNGFQALIKLGLVPYGEIRDQGENCPTLTFNNIGRHVSCMVQTRISSVNSPWLSNVNVGDVHSIAVSHGEGRFVASDAVMQELIKNGQVATQYVDQAGAPTLNIPGNPNGSVMGVEGILSPDGRVFGKMGHSERIGSNVGKNIIGAKDQELFQAGVNYFK